MRIDFRVVLAVSLAGLALMSVFVACRDDALNLAVADLDLSSQDAEAAVDGAIPQSAPR